MRLAASFVLNVALSRFLPFYMNHFDGLCLKEHRKDNGRTRSQMGRKNSHGLRFC